MFSEEFLESVLAQVDIVDVISDYLPLCRGPRAANFKCLCPFHQERHAEVVRSKQFYFCHGCGASGNAFAFLIRYLRVSYPEAVEIVCRKYKIPVRRGEVRVPARETERKKRSRVRRRAHRRWLLHMKECSKQAVYPETFSVD